MKMTSRTCALAVSVVLVAGVLVLYGCEKDPDFSFDGCKSDDEAPAEAIGVYGAFGDVVDTPEDGDSYSELTCVTYGTLNEREIEIAVINFWANCDGPHNGKVVEVSENVFDIKIRKDDCDHEASCVCPYDFSFSLNNMDTTQDLDFSLIRDECSGDNHFQFHAILPIASEPSGTICWQSVE